MGTAFLARTFVKADGNKIAFGILQASGGTATYTASAYDLNTTYLIVIKHDVVSKTSYIVINPSMSAEPTTEWVSNNTGTNATTNIGSVGIRQGSTTVGVSPTLKFDGLRIATSYAALFTTTGFSTLSANNLEVSLVGKKTYCN
jgi:hypothetical protein